MGVDKGTLDQLRIDRKPEREGGLRAGWIVGVLILIVLLGAGVLWWQVRAGGVEVTSAPAREISSGDQRTVLNASGYVTARRDATVSSKVTGKIAEVLVEEGMTVETGQVLARLDTSNVEANLNLAEAELKVAETAVKETEVRLEEAQRELTRNTNLVRDGIVTASQLDAAQAEVDSLRARLERQRQEINVAQSQIGLWRQEIEDRVIRAPFAGVVISKDAQPGEMISPVSAGGGFTRTGICTLVDMESLEIEVDVNESYINRVQAGQAVEATLDAYPSWKIPARVIAIVPTADRQKATVKVRIGFEKLDPRILPDMGVKVAFQDVKGEDAVPESQIVVPAQAVRREGGQDIVFVLRDGHVERRAVTLGETQSDRVVVAAGVRAGERVVVESPDALSDGAAVNEKRD